MALGNFFKGIAAQLLPGGGTFRSYNPRKKKPEEERTTTAPKLTVRQPAATPKLNVQRQPKPQQPENIFETLNKNLTFNKPQNTVPVVSNQDTIPVTRLKPGTLVEPTVQQPKISGVTTAPDRAVRVPGSNTEIRRDPNARVQKEDPNVVARNTPFLKKLVAAPSLSAARVGTGLVQGAAGLVDLLTPGKGQNRVTQGSTRQAERLDTRAKELGVDRAYRTINVPLEIATYFAATPTKAGKVPALANKVRQLIGNSSRGRRIAGQAASEVLDPRNIAQEARITGRYTGQDSARGTAITPEYLAENAAISLFGTAAPAVLRNLRRGAEVRRGVDELEAGVGAETAREGINRVRIPVTQDVPVTQIPDEGVNVPVRPPVIRPGSGPIKEFPTDFTLPSYEKLQEIRAREFNANARPDPAIEGVSTRPADVFTTAKKQEAQVVIDDYLKTGKISEDQHKALTDELEKTPVADAPVPEGRKIEVKQVNTIPVTDQTVVPTDLPETPGTVRAITSTAPSKAKSEAVAAQNPVTVPVEEAPVPSGQREGFAPTGEFGRGKRGNVIERASQEAEAELGTQEMAMRSVDDLLAEVGNKESFTAGDRRRITVALENIAKANPDDRETRLILKKLQSKSRSELGQGLAMIPKVIRRSATSDTLTNRWESKVARALEDPRKMTDADWNRVQTANDKFTLARDRAAQLEEQFKRTGSEADFKAWEEAHQLARKADTDAKFTEAAVAARVLKGEKGASVTKVLDDIKKEADVNTMDSVTASMLSGTATGFRNTLGTEISGLENRLGANIRAKITNKLFDTNVGGFDRKSARMGRKVGMVKLITDAKRRADIGGKNPVEWAKNWATTINSGGESSLQSQVYSRLGKYYRNQFAEQGLKGKELDMRMRHALLTDPDGMGDTFLDATMKSSGLTGIFQKGQTIEKAVVDYVGRQTDSKTAQLASKVLMRIAVGFPTATTNFIAQSGKRLAAGTPSFLETGVKLARGDKAGAALAFERGLKEAGSGLAVLGLGMALGSQDLISGPYPTDPEERARWEREGISENSIKIGGAWYPIPQGAGMFGLPLLTGAALGRGGVDELKSMYSPKNLSKLLPTDQLQGFLNMTSGNGAPQDLKNTLASGIRAATPAGALLNQVSKSLDATKNDTTTKDFWSNVFDQVYSGIPGLNNAMNIPGKTDDAGNPIQNPNPLELALGATSAVQGGGEERSREIDQEINDALSQIDQYGLLSDPNMKGVLKESALDAYNKALAGKQLDESDIKALKEGLVKGVSSEGTDTAYLERGQYDTNLAVLNLKRDLMAEDPTTKPSSLKDIETAIKRGEIYRENEIPYDLISEYKDTTVSEWRNMGNPESDDYDPEMYQRLYEIDQKLTEGGVSYKKGALDKPKYTVKEASSSRGGSGVRQIDTSFGTLKDSSNAPRVQEYSSIDQKTGAVPVIGRVRPNIVHKIGTG